MRINLPIPNEGAHQPRWTEARIRVIVRTLFLNEIRRFHYCGNSDIGLVKRTSALPNLQITLTNFVDFWVPSFRMIEKSCLAWAVHNDDAPAWATGLNGQCHLGLSARARGRETQPLFSRALSRRPLHYESLVSAHRA